MMNRGGPVRVAVQEGGGWETPSGRKNLRQVATPAGWTFLLYNNVNVEEFVSLRCLVRNSGYAPFIGPELKLAGNFWWTFVS